jgi:hypothetical protein
MTRVSVSQPTARTHTIQIREPKPDTLGSMNRSQIGGSRMRGTIYAS